MGGLFGGGGGEQTSTVYQNSLQPFQEPYFRTIMDRGMSLANQPYQAYQGQRIADMSGQTQAGLNMAQNYAQSGMPGMQNATSLTNAVGQAAMDMGNYQAGGVQNTYGGPAAWQNGQFGTQQTGFGTNDINQLTSQNFDQAMADKYMSPYMQDVTNAAVADRQLAAGQEQAYLKGQAAQAGAFGGSRAAVQNQISLGQAQRDISNIQVQGKQAAFENAQQQFERDQARNAQAQQGNLSAAMSMAQDNANRNLQTQQMAEQSRQFGYQQGEQGRQAASQLGMQAQQTTEQLRQSGKQLGLQGLQLAGSSAGQMANLQQMQDAMTKDRINTMLGVGQTGEQYQQKALDMAYQDFLNQQNYPWQTTSMVSSLLRGLPFQGSTQQTVTQTSPSNPLAGALGYGMAYNAMNNLGNGRGMFG